MGSTGPARNSVSSTSWPNRAWASPACCMSSADASAGSAPLSCQEAARPMVSRHHSFPSWRSFATQFQVGAGEAEKEIAQKLEVGLTAVGLNSPQNLGLLLHLLGLNVPSGALTGLDGVLIGLRTRDLLQQLLEVRCRLSPVVIVIEDLHWIDTVSEEVLGKIVGSEAQLRLLVLPTRRPEYEPPWLDRTVVTKLHLEPLPDGDIRRLVQARLGVEVLPETLVRQVAEKAEGNPLFRGRDRELPHRAWRVARSGRQGGVRHKRGGGRIAGKRAKSINRSRGPSCARRTARSCKRPR